MRSFLATVIFVGALLRQATPAAAELSGFSLDGAGEVPDAVRADPEKFSEFVTNGRAQHAQLCVDSCYADWLDWQYFLLYGGANMKMGNWFGADTPEMEKDIERSEHRQSTAAEDFTLIGCVSFCERRFGKAPQADPKLERILLEEVTLRFGECVRSKGNTPEARVECKARWSFGRTQPDVNGVETGLHQIRGEKLLPRPQAGQRYSGGSGSARGLRYTMRLLRSGGATVGPAAARASLLRQMSRVRNAAASAGDRLRGHAETVGRFGRQDFVDALTGGANAHTQTGGASTHPVGGAAGPALPMRVVP